MERLIDKLINKHGRSLEYERGPFDKTEIK